MKHCLYVDIAGTALSEEDRFVLAHPAVSGIVLFSRNFSSNEQLIALTTAIHGVNPQLVIAVDQEGGRVQRFREGFTRIPSMRTLGERYDASPADALALAQHYGETLGQELRAHGVDMTFAPVLDIDDGHGAGHVIGDRAFHSDPDVIILLATALMRGIESQGCRAVGKHYPGHGYVAGDSHLTQPVDERSYAVIAARDLRVFRALIAAGLTGIMASHVIYPAVDDLPAGFSRHWLHTVLRGECQFTGTIYSDALDMAGAAAVGSMHARVERALSAGCDQVLICNDRPGVLSVLHSQGRIR